MPTILEMEGIAWPSQVQGRSLVPLFFEDKKTEENIAYSETYYPRFHFGWSELKGIQDGRFKLIIAPELELYDLVNDPDEEINLASTKRDELKRLKTLAGRFIEESSRNAFELDYRNVDEETRQKLAALGYVGSFTDTSRLQGKELANPRDKIGVFNRIAEARELSLGDEFERAVSMIEEIIKEDSDIIDAYFTLGNIYFNKNKFKEALDYYLKVFDMKPDHAFNIINIANSYLGLGKLEEAEKIISDTMELVPPDSLLYYCLGSINKLQKKYEQAKKYLQKCLDLNPYSASGYSEMGAIYVIQERLDEAEKYLRKAIEINPKMMNVHYNFAQFFEKKGNLLQAAEEYRKELDNIPHHFRASYNLSVVYRNLGDTENEEKYLEKTIEINPDFPLSYFFLARIYLHRGRNYKKAIDLVNKGIGLKPDREHLSLGYFLLADLYNRLGDNSLSLRYAQKGKEILRSVSREE
jgi:tetratricopeptide (TPR) repeat protein